MPFFVSCGLITSTDMLSSPLAVLINLLKKSLNTLEAACRRGVRLPTVGLLISDSGTCRRPSPLSMWEPAFPTQAIKSYSVMPQDGAKDPLMQALGAFKPAN